MAVVLATAVSCAACQPAPVRPSPRATPNPIVPRPRSLPDEDWAVVELRSVGVRLRLPDGASWRRVSSRDAEFRAEHPPTKSSLRVAAWPTERAASAEACARRARLVWPEIPDRDARDRLDVRVLDVASGYRGFVVVAARAVTVDRWVGRLVAVGVRPGRCLVLAFATQAIGPGAGLAVADALALISAGTVDRLEPLGIEDRVVPKPAWTD
jgi:hypothetical protein